MENAALQPGMTPGVRPYARTQCASSVDSTESAQLIRQLEELRAKNRQLTARNQQLEAEQKVNDEQIRKKDEQLMVQGKQLILQAEQLISQGHQIRVKDERIKQLPEQSTSPVKTNKKTQRQGKKAVAKKAKVESSFKPWDNEKKACFAYQSGTVHFCYRKECKKIPFRSDSQAPLVIASFLKGPIAGKRIKELAESNSEPSQIVRNINRTINTQLRKIGFTDIQKVGFIYYDDGTNKYRLSPDIVDYAIYLAHQKENG